MRESTLSLTSGSIWTAPRQSLHCVLPGPQPAIAPQADPSQHSAALPGPSGPLGDSILRSLVCSTGQPWWRDVSGSSGQDVYAVGFFDASTSLKGKFSLAARARLFAEGVILHYDGSTWQEAQPAAATMS